MNEWGFIGQDIFVGIGKSAASRRPQVLNLYHGVATSPSRSISGARCARGEVSAF